MNEIKKEIKKLPKKSLVLILILAMVLNYILPLEKVFADGEYVLTFTATGEHTMENDGNHLKIDGQYVDLRDANDNTKNIGTVACTSNKSCTITVTDGTPGKVDNNEAGKFTLYVSGHRIDYNSSVNANEAYAVQDYEEQNNNQPGNQGNEEPIEPNFDGKAYVIWSCGNGICYKHFDNIPNFDDGNSTFYKDTEIVADNKAGETFNLNATYKGWSTDDRFNAWVTAYKVYKNITGDIDWTTVNPEDMIGDPIDMREYEDKAIQAGKCTKDNTPQDEFEACVDQYVAENENVWASRAQLQPVGEPTYNNAYVSYGDRNFKVVIYNSNYKGLKMGSLDELSYYPAEWANQFIKRDQYDISGTTKEKPTGIDTILLEKIVRLKEIDANGYSITKIEALDVPSDAINIAKVDGEWRLDFSSNFYDNVVFEATDSNGGKSYFQIKRTTIDGWIKFVENKPVLNADFYFDRTKSYTDFELTAVIEYRDGTEKNVKLNAVKGIDDGLGNVADVYELDEENPAFGPAGKGLKKACFQYALADGEDKNIKRVYLNAEYKGSTATNYAGSYAGSGKGVLANIYVPEEEEVLR